MLSYQKNALLSLLAQFKVRLLEVEEPKTQLVETSFGKMEDGTARNSHRHAIYTIDRNLTSIEKQLKKL